MNKKAETGFYIGVAILSVILVVLGARVAFISSKGYINTKPGTGLGELINKELRYNDFDNYISYSFRFSVLSALNDALERNDVWGENQKEVIKNEIFEKARENLLKTIGILKNQEKIDTKEVTFPEKFKIEIIEETGSFKAVLVSEDELMITDMKKDYPIVELHNTLRSEEKIDFDLSRIDRLYDKYSKLESEGECNDLKENELFDENKVKCYYDTDFLNFEAETNGIGLISQTIKFKISKPGKIEFTNE